MINFQALGV